MQLSRAAVRFSSMSYSVTLRCGCRVYVSCHPQNGIAHTRIIEHRSATCAVRAHDIGVRVPSWEVLPYEPDESLEYGESRVARRA